MSAVAVQSACAALRSKGVNVSVSWALQCVANLSVNGVNVSTLDDLVRALYTSVLSLDMNGMTSDGAFSAMSSLHSNGGLMRWTGLFMLQIEEIMNVGVGADKKSEFNRLLKLKLSDGANLVIGIELTIIKGLSVKTAPGTKILLIDPIARHGVLLLTDLICKVIGGGSENRPTKSSSNSTDPIFDGSGANPSRRLALPNENAIEKEATINFFASSGNVTETKVPDKISSIDKDSEIYQDEFSDEYFQDPDDDEMEMCIGIHNDLEIPPMKSYPTSNGSEIMSSSAPLNPKKIIPEQDDTIPPINVLVSKKVEKQYRSGKELDDNLVIPPPPSHSMHRPQTTVTSMHRDKNGSLADVESNEDLMISSADPNSNNRGMSSSSGFGAAAAETKSINQILQYVANGATDDALWTVSLSATGVSKFKVIDEEFQVVLWVEDKVNGANRSNIAIPATEIAVSNNVCTEFLALSAADYAAMTSHCSKAELKESKKQVCLRFEKFAGLFLVQIVSPTFKSTNKSGKSSSSSSSQSPSVCIVKIAALDD